jgi:hypothetical protein
MYVPALQAEAKLAGQEPVVPPRTDPPVRLHQKLFGCQVAMGSLQPRLAGRRGFDPRFRVVLHTPCEIQGSRGRVAQEEPEPLTLCIIIGIGPVLALAGLSWHVVDVAGQQQASAALVAQAHGVVVLAAGAAEVGGVKALGRVGRQELLPVKLHRPRFVRVERRVRHASAADELM